MNKDISILHITECAGGVERYLQELLPRMKALGFKQNLICSTLYDKAYYDTIVDEVVQVKMERSFSPLGIIRVVNQIRKEIKRIQPDAVYCHSSFAGGLGRIATLGLPVKVIYNPHGWGFQCITSRKKAKVFCLLERMLALCTDKIVCISQAEKTAALKLHIANEDKLAIITNGVNIENIQKAAPFKREELGIKENAFVVGMTARLTGLKDPDTFVRAAELIYKRIPNSTFLLVGDGEERERIEQIAKEKHLPLFVTGWTNEPYRYMKVFNVGMLLSRWWEGFGLAVVEYMAAGVNVVATRTGGIPELISDGADGLLVDVESPEQVCNQAVWLYEHPDKASIMQKTALDKVSNYYAIERVDQQHSQLIVNLCKSGGVIWNNNPNETFYASVAVLYNEERWMAA